MRSADGSPSHRGPAWAWETGRIAGYCCHVAHALDGLPRTIVVLNNTDMDQALIEEAVIEAAKV